jgi:arginine/serine-rich splicing factor 2
VARRTGDSRGFAFVRYKYADEAQKAIDRLDGGVWLFLGDFLPLSIRYLNYFSFFLCVCVCAGRNVDGRNIMVQFAKYGPNAEPM